MEKIDSHNHFWQYDAIRDSWIADDMNVVRRDFLPEDLEPVLKECNIDGTVAVQASCSEAETEFLLNLARQNDFIRGIVGWVDLKGADIEERLSHYSKEKKVKGFRHILQMEDVEGYLNNKNFLHGISLLDKYGFTYDILVYHYQLKYVEAFVEHFPSQRFVVDHLAKPDIKTGAVGIWGKEITALAKHDNVYCKISGMVTEADWKEWNPEHLKPYLDVAVQAFGTDRILFGSDWPVCLVAASYKDWLKVLEDYFADFSSDENANIFGGNASRLYRL
ncbi:MAG: amidohydrolase family protein [Chitinophagaceae bacterium]